MLGTEDYLKYYSRRDVQKAIVEQASNREVGVMFSKGFFGKRPDVLEFESDVLNFAKKGATSFHISEERWYNPLNLKTGLNRTELNELRSGWDLILDIDTKFWDYAKQTAYLLVEALKYHNISSVSVKFSGNKGFHILVPFETFPQVVLGKEIKDLYPDSPRIIASYLSHLIEPLLKEYILSTTDIKSLVKYSKIDQEQLVVGGQLQPFKLIDIDTILISSRHLFRSPYSLHEKSGLASIPFDLKKILKFNKKDAKPENVDTTKRFMPKDPGDNEAKELFIQAFDWYYQKNKKSSEKKETQLKTKIELPQEAVPETKFAPCIRNILKGNLEDGKKRSLFILLRYLKLMNWPWDKIEQEIKKWNERNPTKLSESYIQTQINWHKRQKEIILVPNCSNSSYYKDLNICTPDGICKKISNPFQYHKRKRL